MWPRIPDRTKFNWKQESRGQVWVWDGDDNEKMTGPSRREGDRGGWSHGEDGTYTHWKLPWESWTREEEHRLGSQGEAAWVSRRREAVKGLGVGMREWG